MTVRADRTLTAAAFTLLALLGLGTITAQEPPASGEAAEASPRHDYGELVSVFTGGVEVPENTVRHGDVVCIGGHVRVAGEVRGSVVVVMGSLELTGAVSQDVVGVLSELRIDGVEIDGDLINVLGGLDRRETRVGGQFTDIGVGAWFPGVLTLLTWFRVVGILVVFVLLVVLVALAPERVRLIGEQAPVRYVSAFFLGILGYLLLIVVLLPLATVTLIGLPILWISFAVVKWLALGGMFHELGSRIGRGFGREMSPLGAVLLVFGLYAALMLGLSALGVVGLFAIGLLRLLFWLLFEVPAVGLAMLTRLGTRRAGEVTLTGREPLPRAVPADPTPSVDPETRHPDPPEPPLP